jgi:hypothetical protein
MNYEPTVTPLSARFPRSAVGEVRNIRRQRYPNLPSKTMRGTNVNKKKLRCTRLYTSPSTPPPDAFRPGRQASTCVHGAGHPSSANGGRGSGLWRVPVAQRCQHLNLIVHESRSNAREHTLQALALAAAWPRVVPEASELRTTSTKATRAAQTKLEAGGRRLPLDPHLRIA